MKILVIELSNLGDAILTYPALEALRRAHPQAEFHVLASPRTRELFEGDPRFRRVWVWEKRGSFLGRLGLIMKLVSARYGVVVDFRNSLIPLLMPWAKRTPVLRRPSRDLHRADAHLKLVTQFSQDPREGLLRPRTSEGRAGKVSRAEGEGRARPDAERGSPRWGDPSGARRSRPERGSLPYSSEEEAWAAGWMEPGRPVVLMAPGSRSHLKRWAADRFAAVADRLAAECHAQILLVGGEEEREISEAVIRAMRGKAKDLTGGTTLRQLAALLARAELLVTNDSACLHAAEGMGVPSVAIFGPTDEKRYGPRDPRSAVVRRRLVCAPCERALCPYGHECMKWIPAEEVFSAAEKILECHPRESGDRIPAPDRGRGQAFAGMTGQ